MLRRLASTACAPSSRASGGALLLAGAGDLVHLDTKKLGRIGPGGGSASAASLKDRHRGIGWNVVHVAVDDATRLAYAEELPDELGGRRPPSWSAPAFYAAHGIAVRAPAHRQRLPYRSRAFRSAVGDAGLASSSRGPTGRRPTARPRPS